jgi:predicted metal-dependent phosphoesterase TrpH
VALPAEPADAVDLSGIPLLQVAPVVIAAVPAAAVPVAAVPVAPAPVEVPPTPQIALPPATPQAPQPLDVADISVSPIAVDAVPAPVVVAALIEPQGTPMPVADVLVEQVTDVAAPMPPTPESFEPPAVTATAPAVPAGPAVNNACFATRVRGWGNVERFPSTTFRPGQEVIVYFELDQLASRESAEGHTTRIDTVLRLVDASGRRVHEWTFEPLEETCGSHRRDYFARYLVESGFCADTHEVFRKYLTDGKPGFVPHRWASLKEAVQWITDAQGIAVIAHPARYNFTPNEEYAFFTEFKNHGGQGVEVVTGSHTVAEYVKYGDMAKEFDLLASRGSDFHSPEESRIDLGTLPWLPGQLTPVWEALAHRIQ